MADPTAPLPRAYFRPHALDNLTLVDELDSLCPIIDAKVMNMLPNSDTPQIFAACGRGARSTFRTLRHGLEVEEVVSSDLPGIPNAVWTTKLKEDGESRCVPSYLYPLTQLYRSLRLLHHPVLCERHSCALHRRDHRRGSRHRLSLVGSDSRSTADRRRRAAAGPPARHSTCLIRPPCE